MKSCTCHNCERAGLSASDYYHADTAISACVDSLMRGMDRNPFDETRKPCASVADIIATIETIYGKRAAYTSRFTEMPSIPGRFERDMSVFHNLHATIACKISINRNAALRTTVGGDVAVNAEKQLKKTRAEVDELLPQYAEMARELASRAGSRD